MKQVHLQRNQVNRNMLMKQKFLSNRVQKPWSFEWKKYSERVNKQQKLLRDYMLHLCEDHTWRTQFSMELKKVRLFLTQHSDKFLIKFFIIRMKSRMKQLQTQRHKFFLLGFDTYWSWFRGLSCPWGWTM